MDSQVVTVEMPARLYGKLSQRAADAQRSVEQELISVLATKFADEEQERALIERKLAGMESYTDKQLWEAAGQGLSPENCERSQDLNDKQRSEELTPAERLEL